MEYDECITGKDERWMSKSGLRVDFRDAYVAICQVCAANKHSTDLELAWEQAAQRLQKGIQHYEDYFQEKWPEEAAAIIKESDNDAIAAINAVIDMINDEADELVESRDTDRIQEYYDQLEAILKGEISPTNPDGDEGADGE